MSDNSSVKVAVRIRPLANYEITKGCKDILDVIPENEQVIIRGTEKAFTFNYILSPDSTQEELYDKCVKDMIQSIFKGYNMTILAYGQTGSGKTYSMGTAYKGEGDMGVIPRAINDIFEYVRDHFTLDFTITVSFIELYQEVLYDLLSGKSREQCILEIREDVNKGPNGTRSNVCILNLQPSPVLHMESNHWTLIGNRNHIPGITEIPVTNSTEVLEALARGSAGRATGATNMNSQSSRSHAIFTISICMQSKEDCNDNKMAKLHLVDLAGSERPKKTGAVGNTFKEGININKGLFVLGNVISCLGDEKNQSTFVPYRDSNLTRLLKDSLGGNSITLMIACVSPADYNLDETVSTLRYADRAKKIKNKPIVNQDSKVAEINELKRTIQQLRLQIVGQGGPVICPAEIELLKRKILELEQKIRELNLQLSSSLVDKTGLFEKIIILQSANEKLSERLNELGNNFETTLANLSVAFENNDTFVIKQNISKLQDIQNIFMEINTEQKQAEKEIKNHEATFEKELWNTSDDFPANIPTDIHEQQDAYTHKQVALNTELQVIRKELAMKESLAQQLITNTHNIVDYNAMAQNEEKIKALETEKEELMQQLKNAHSHESNGKIAEQRRKRVKELESQIHDLNRKLQEQSKLIRLKEKDEQRIKQLNKEILEMKQARVKLIRNMREESDKFKSWKLQRERELVKLKKEDKKKENEMVKMKQMYSKQHNVLKRKVEEANALNKRLQESLKLRKQAQDMRNNGKIDKVGNWFKQEFNVFLNLIEVEETVSILLEDRAKLQQQLDMLKSNPNSAELEDCKSIEEDIECRSAQIQDLQQKLLECDEENKAKSRFDNIQTMAEAKLTLKLVFEHVAEMKRKAVHIQFKLTEAQGALAEVMSNKKDYETDKKAIEERYDQHLSELQRTYEEKIALLLRQRRGVKVDDVSAETEMEQHCRILEEQNEKQEQIIAELERKLEIIKNAGENGRSTPNNLIQKKLKVPKVPLDSTFVKLEDEGKENILESSLEDIIDDDPNDPDWRKTPLGKRIIQEKKRLTYVRNTTLDFEEDRLSVKRSSHGGCTCKTKCTARCGCKKMSKQCTDNCKCTAEHCVNRDSSTIVESSVDDSVNSNNGTGENESFKKPRFEDTHISKRNKSKKGRNLFVPSD